MMVQDETKNMYLAEIWAQQYLKEKNHQVLEQALLNQFYYTTSIWDWHAYFFGCFPVFQSLVGSILMHAN